MSARAIKKLQVMETIRQVDAAEVCTPRYLGFFCLTIALNWLVQVTNLAGDPRETTIFLSIAGTVLLVVLFRPWHRRFHVDVDGPTCCFEWRLLGFFPFLRRYPDLTGRILSVQRRHTTIQQGGTDSAGVGCLALMLPFPLSLLTALSAGGGSRGKTVTRVYHMICIRNPEGDRVEDLAMVAAPSVARAFLAAVEEVLPDHVEGPSGMTDLPGLALRTPQQE